MPTPGVKWEETKSWEIAFQFISGRTQTQTVAAGAFGNRMLYSCVFGLCRVLCTSSVEPLSTCLQNEWWLLKTRWYLPSFCLPTHYAETKWLRWDGGDWMSRQAGKGFGAEYLETDCYSEHSPALSGGQQWTGVFFSGTFQEAAFITDALSPYCLN